MPFGSASSLAVTALNSLANNTFWKSDAITFNANSVTAAFHVSVSTANTGAGLATGYLNVYLACSNDNTTYDGTVTPGDGTWSTSAPATATSALGLQYLGRIPTNSTATTTIIVGRTFFVPISSMPKYGALIIENQTGKSLLGSGNSVSYVEFTTA